VATGVPFGATVTITCHGKHCPFKVHRTIVQKPKPCKKGAKRCHAPRAAVVNLAASIKNKRFRPGNVVEVAITRSNWIGKDYRFTILGGHAPRIGINCLAPGGTKPGVGC
jgi:hypothetical protein